MVRGISEPDDRCRREARRVLKFVPVRPRSVVPRSSPHHAKWKSEGTVRLEARTKVEGEDAAPHENLTPVYTSRVRGVLLLSILLASCRHDHAVIDAGAKIEDALRQESRLPRDRVSVTSRPLEVRTPSIVFVLAVWSAQSMNALHHLTTILAADSFAPPFVIVDGDDEAAVSTIEPGASGAGETFWVRDGKVVATINRYDELREDAVAKNNALLR